MAPSLPDRISAALDSLLARCAERVRVLSRSHRLDAATIDEVFQEVRVRIWKAFPDQPEKVAALPASYVYQTASAAAIDLIRRRRARRADVTDSIEDAAPPALRVEGPGDRAIEAQELRTKIAEAMADVPASRRPIVRMFLSGYDRLEIVATLGWSEPKVRNLLYRGLEDLREALRRRGVGPGGIE